MTRVLLPMALLLALVSSCVPCEPVGVNLGRACVPATMAADTELEIEVEEACGTTCASPPTCAATLDVTNVLVVTGQDECTADCRPTGQCQQRRATCRLPALPAGTYTVLLPGLPSRTLVTEDGAPASCTL